MAAKGIKVNSKKIETLGFQQVVAAAAVPQPVSITARPASTVVRSRSVAEIDVPSFIEREASSVETDARQIEAPSSFVEVEASSRPRRERESEATRSSISRPSRGETERDGGGGDTDPTRRVAFVEIGADERHRSDASTAAGRRGEEGQRERERNF